MRSHHPHKGSPVALSPPVAFRYGSPWTCPERLPWPRHGRVSMVPSSPKEMSPLKTVLSQRILECPFVPLTGSPSSCQPQSVLTVPKGPHGPITHQMLCMALPQKVLVVLCTHQNVSVVPSPTQVPTVLSFLEGPYGPVTPKTPPWTRHPQRFIPRWSCLPPEDPHGPITHQRVLMVLSLTGVPRVLSPPKGSHGLGIPKWSPWPCPTGFPMVSSPLDELPWFQHPQKVPMLSSLTIGSPLALPHNVPMVGVRVTLGTERHWGQSPEW